MSETKTDKAEGRWARSDVIALVGVILTLFVVLYWDLQARLARLEGAFGVAQSLMFKPVVTQTVVVTTVTAPLTTTTTTAIEVLTGLNLASWILALLAALIVLLFVRALAYPRKS
jgi:disulfide bond formation protein DsbB